MRTRQAAQQASVCRCTAKADDHMGAKSVAGAAEDMAGTEGERKRYPAVSERKHGTLFSRSRTENISYRRERSSAISRSRPAETKLFPGEHLYVSLPGTFQTLTEDAALFRQPPVLSAGDNIPGPPSHTRDPPSLPCAQRPAYSRMNKEYLSRNAENVRKCINISVRPDRPHRCGGADRARSRPDIRRTSSGT